MSILDSINTPEDLKKVSEDSLIQLCQEIRQKIIDDCAENPGHLGSSLGVVELTVALHYILDTPYDNLVWDVGHQSYAHKILTGRADRFPTLRQLGGISGFPKPCESAHDAFIAGHASNSVSVALGMARARTLQHQDYSVLALIGDGALSGGLAYEGLNNAGASGEPLIVILNDNGMSIDRNVGAMSEHLSRLRTKPEYFAFKKAYHNALSGTAAGRALYRFNHSLKTGLKKAMLPNATMFEDMGFAYLGPVDGHDLAQLTTTLEWAREMKRPVLVHVRTQKGHGYAPAEREPWKFHGVGPFDAVTGAVPPAKESFSSVFGAALTELAEEDQRVCAITAAMEDGTGLTPFAGRFPDRFFDVGIAEGHAAAMAAGLAKQGGVCGVSIFLQRGYDMLLHDVALSGLHVVFAVDRAGLVGADGATHHGVMDTVFLSGIPNMKVLCPASFAELCAMLRRALFEMTGPVAIRYPRGGEGAFTADTSAGDFAELRAGEDITLCAYGTLINNVLGAAELLHEDGIEARVVKLNRISPFRGGELSRIFGTTKRLLVAEECSGVGCIGQRIAAILAEEGHEPQRLMLCNLGRRFIEQGSVGELYRQCGLDAESLARTAKEVCQ